MKRLALTALFLVELLLLAMIVSPVVNAEESACPVQPVYFDVESYGRFINVEAKFENVSNKKLRGVAVGLLFLNSSGKGIGNDTISCLKTTRPGGILEISTIRPVPTGAVEVTMPLVITVAEDGTLFECQ